jgi:hypothetical protein
VNTCGACNVTCSNAHGTTSCPAGSCAVGGCNGGFANCDSVVSNGCEVTLATTRRGARFARYGAQRLRFSLGGALTACTGASGTATVQSFDIHTIGCRLESGADCNSSEYTHIDTNAVMLSVGSSSYTMTRLGATGSTFSCAQLRAAL